MQGEPLGRAADAWVLGSLGLPARQQFAPPPIGLQSRQRPASG